MIPDFCPRCGKPTKRLIPDPEFCGGCGLLLIALDDQEDQTVALANNELTATYSPYADLDDGQTWQIAFDGMVGRYADFGIPLPLEVGVIIDMGVPVEASMPMHRRNFDSKIADPSQRPLPYNLMVDPFAKAPKLWEDAKERCVSRAAAIAYYWGGKGLGKVWHFDEALDPKNLERLVTVDDQTIDFELRFLSDMLVNHEESGEFNYTRVLPKALAALEGYLRDGINTQSRRVEAVGQPLGWAVFGMDELDPKHRSPE